MQSITAEKRDILGKKTKNLRKKGILPAVLYGKGQNSESISVKENDFLKLWKSAGESTVVTLEVGSDKKNVLIHDVAVDPLKDTPTHVDFYIVDMNKPITIDVVLEFVGESDAVKAGGILVKVLHEVKIEALPKDLPHSLSVDISSLKEMTDTVTVKDIKLPHGVKMLDNLDETIVLVEPPRSEEELKAAEEAAPSLETIEELSKKPKAEGEEEAAASTETKKAPEGKKAPETKK